MEARLAQHDRWSNKGGYSSVGSDQFIPARVENNRELLKNDPDYLACKRPLKRSESSAAVNNRLPERTESRLQSYMESGVAVCDSHRNQRHLWWVYPLRAKAGSVTARLPSANWLTSNGTS